MIKLELTFSTRGEQTFLKHQFVKSPLKIIRPFNLSNGRVLLQLVNVGPGIMAKDAFDINITLQQNAKVVLINQSATKLHTMPLGEKASQYVQINVAENAELEYYPGLSIPYKDSHFEQHIRVDLAENTKFAFLERWAMGRIAFNERFLFQKLSSQVKLYQNKQILYADALELSKKDTRLGSTDNFNYLATGVWFWNTLPQFSTSEAITRLNLEDNAFVCSALKGKAAYVRALANDGLSLNKQIGSFINNWRVQVGLEQLELHRFSS